MPFLYVSEIWTLIKKKDKNWLTLIKMKHFRITAGYTLFDHIGIEEALEETKEELADQNSEDANQIGYDM